MKKLTKHEVLRILPGTPVHLVHQEKGSWEDIADGVYSVMDCDDLHLTETDLWLNCDEYESVWIAYVKE